MAQAIKLEIEAQYFLKRMQAIGDARRTGDAAALSEALDDMEVVCMHAYNPQIKDRAARALATH